MSHITSDSPKPSCMRLWSVSNNHTLSVCLLHKTFPALFNPLNHIMLTVDWISRHAFKCCCSFHTFSYILLLDILHSAFVGGKGLTINNHNYFCRPTFTGINNCNCENQHYHLHRRVRPFFNDFSFVHVVKKKNTK